MLSAFDTCAFGACFCAEARKKTGEAWVAGTSSKTAAQMEKSKKMVASKLGVKRNSGLVKKTKAAAGKATTLAGKASEAAQGAATAAQEAAGTVATVAQGAATTVKDAAASAVQSIQKVS